MRPALRHDLRHAGILDAEFFSQQGAHFVELVVLRRESHPRIDAIGGPGTCVHDDIVGEGHRMEYRRLYLVLPALGKMALWRLRFVNIVTCRKRVLESFQLKNTIGATDSESFGPLSEPKDSVDQDTAVY
jgi:hypothetical protein